MALHEAVIDFLRQAMVGRDIEKWNPLANIEVSNDLISRNIEVYSAQLTVAIGLGLRRTE